VNSYFEKSSIFESYSQSVAFSGFAATVALMAEFRSSEAAGEEL
jgi:hypothetical protein